jgi:hypothetical protein
MKELKNCLFVEISDLKEFFSRYAIDKNNLLMKKIWTDQRDKLRKVYLEERMFLGK